MTTTFEIELGRSALGLRWPDGRRRDYPYIWLRDSDPAAFHPDTQERTGDLLDIPEEPVAETAGLSGDGLEIAWRDGGTSRFSLDWLAEHGPGAATPDPADLPHETWRADFAVPRHDAGTIARDEGALRDWIRDLVTCGLTIVEGVATEPGAGLALARRIGFLRKTNFGESFEVVSKPFGPAGEDRSSATTRSRARCPARRARSAPRTSAGSRSSSCRDRNSAPSPRPCGETISIRLVPMKASVTATFSAPKNSGSVFGSAIFQKIVICDAPSERRMSRYSGSSVDSPIETDTAIGKNEIMKAISTVLKSCCRRTAAPRSAPRVALGIALKPTSSG
jgi:hypothetical protein